MADEIPMTDAGDETVKSEPQSAEAHALVSRLRVIEEQPLEQRAEAFARVHEQLQAALEGADAPRA
jgi:hypothetical protein